MASLQRMAAILYGLQNDASQITVVTNDSKNDRRGLHGTVTGLQADVAALQTSVAALQAAVTALQPATATGDALMTLTGNG